MDAVFLKLLNLSLTASWLCLAVLLVRLLLKKAPKAISCALWALVGLRLLFPFSIESMLSLIPSAEPLPEDILLSPTPTINSGIPVINEVVNPVISDSLAPTPGDSVNPLQVITTVAGYVWLVGMAAMLVYMLVTYLRVKSKVAEAVKIEGNVYECDHVDTPFILGVIRPRIYLPSSMNEADRAFVIAHEQAHLRRLDHVWKPLGFLLLTVYWFNPLLWLGYILLCRDIELACDEKVIRQLGTDIKKQYSEALINCSVPRRAISACPLAFGEVGVKGRIKSVLNYKKPAFWIILVAVVALVVTGVCFLTDPPGEDPRAQYYSEYSSLYGGVTANSMNWFIGEILEINEDTFLVRPHHKSYEYQISEKISVPRTTSSKYDDTYLQDLKIGDDVYIYYTGKITNSDPAQLKKVHKIELQALPRDQKFYENPRYTVLHDVDNDGKEEYCVIAYGPYVKTEEGESLTSISIHVWNKKATKLEYSYDFTAPCYDIQLIVRSDGSLWYGGGLGYYGDSESPPLIPKQLVVADGELQAVSLYDTLLGKLYGEIVAELGEPITSIEYKSPSDPDTIVEYVYIWPFSTGWDLRMAFFETDIADQKEAYHYYLTRIEKRPTQTPTLSNFTFWDFTTTPEIMYYSSDKANELSGTRFVYEGLPSYSQFKKIKMINNAGKETELISGTVVMKAGFADLNGDGYNEFLGQANIGSGYIHEFIVVYDIKNDRFYRLEERFSYDFYLVSPNNALSVTIFDVRSNSSRIYQATPFLVKRGDDYVLELRRGSDVLYRSYADGTQESLLPDRIVSYVFQPDNDWMNRATVTLYADQTFQFVFSPVSSYLGNGTYEIKDDWLILSTDDGKYTYIFEMHEDKLVYRENVNGYHWMGKFTDGSEFILQN